MTFSTASSGTLLRMIYERKAKTRNELAEFAGLSRSAAGLRVEALLASGLLTESGSTSTAGRRAVNFAFNYQAGVLLVADIGVSVMETAITDLAGEILKSEVAQVSIDAGPDSVLAEVSRSFSRQLTAIGADPSRVWGIGIGIPGPVQYSIGTPIEPPTMPGWDGFDIPRWLADDFACPVFVDQDTNCMALGEQRANWPDVDSLLLVRLDYGIGAGMIINSEIYRGAQGAAGDIGHLHLRGYTEMPCRCGRFGCVEAATGGWALIRDLKARGHEITDTQQVVTMLADKNTDAVELLQEASGALGEAIAAAVNITNPSVVAIGGILAHARSDLLARIRAVVYERSLPLATRQLTLTTANATSAQLVGAALLVADTVASAGALDRRLTA